MNKKYIMLIGIIIAIFTVVILVLVKTNIIGIEVSKETEENIVNENNNSKDVVPEEEISDEQMRTSKIKLYFEGKDGALAEETRDVDVKELINDPYKTIINKLIEGPTDENNKKLIPDNTSINKAERVGDTLEIDFSSEYSSILDTDKNRKKLIEDSILKSVKELREINSIKILVNGTEIKDLKKSDSKFSY